MRGKSVKGNMSTFLFLLVSQACLSCETQAFLFFCRVCAAKWGGGGAGGEAGAWEVVEYDECENVFSGRVL